MTHDDELLHHVAHLMIDVNALLPFLAPFAEPLFLLLTSPEEKDASLGMLLDELLDDLLHQHEWIDLSLMGRKGGYADEGYLRAGLWSEATGETCRQLPNVALTVAKHTLEVDGDRITQTIEHFYVVLKRGGLLHELLMVALHQAT